MPALSSTRSAARLTLAAVLLVALAACSSTKDEPEYTERPVEQLYNDAMDALLAGNNQTAARLFDEVERQHPYSVWATKAQLMSGYANFEADKYDDAVIAVDRYIQLHPSSPDTPYAYYLKALTYYEQISDVGRDQKMTQRASEALTEIIRRYPGSDFARDASLKLDLTRDHLAGKEMDVGRFYLRQRQYLAAINRFKRVVDEYQTTTHVPEALHRLIEAYTALGLTEDARKVAAVLGHNFPGSEWYADTYALVEGVDVRPPTEKPGLLTRAWKSVF